MSKNSIVTLFMAIFLLICMPLVSFAEGSEDIPSVEELVEFTKDASMHGGTLFGGGGVLSLFNLKRNSPDDPTVKWAEEQGLMPETLIKKSATELYGINRHTGEFVPLDPQIYGGITAHALPETVTMFDLKEIFLSSFTSDYQGAFSCPNNFHHDKENCFYPSILTDKDGRLYTVPMDLGDTSFSEINSMEEFYKSAKITNQTANTIEMTFYAPDPQFSWTVNFRKTADGWRISGGSYFPSTSMMPMLPPQTGDSTPVYLTISLLSLAVLTVTAVGVSKKRKKGFKI